MVAVGLDGVGVIGADVVLSGASADVAVELFDIAGHRTATLFHGRQPMGEQRVTWSGSPGGHDVPAGVYFVHLVIDRRIEETLKLVHLRD